jgi:hypothetical protein
MNKVRYTITTGFSVTIYRANGERNYSPSIPSFSRYVQTLKKADWKETRCGMGVSVREPK